MSEGSKPIRIGLLGRGTVGAAFADLLAERADAVEAATGRRPEISGVLTRSEGDFGAILERSDLILAPSGVNRGYTSGTFPDVTWRAAPPSLETIHKCHEPSG